MDARLLRILWAVIDATPGHFLDTLDDGRLRCHLLSQVTNQVCLSGEEASAMHAYIETRTPLIRSVVCP